jgi:hypothetical protein
VDSLKIRASSVLFFGVIFFILEQFHHDFLNVIMAIALSYVCINLVSIRLLGRV